eukprot:350653-Chlamydomonas_euryale.AAC.4
MSRLSEGTDRCERASRRCPETTNAFVPPAAAPAIPMASPTGKSDHGAWRPPGSIAFAARRRGLAACLRCCAGARLARRGRSAGAARLPAITCINQPCREVAVRAYPQRQRGCAVGTPIPSRPALLRPAAATVDATAWRTARRGRRRPACNSRAGAAAADCAGRSRAESDRLKIRRRIPAAPPLSRRRRRPCYNVCTAAAAAAAIGMQSQRQDIAVARRARGAKWEAGPAPPARMATSLVPACRARCGKGRRRTSGGQKRALGEG